MSPPSSPKCDPNLEKRVKRRVIGRNHSFFAVTAPGLEPLCLRELNNLPLTAKDGRAVTGGVEFTGRLEDCYLANLNLRTATRILMRIGEVRATRFDQLEKALDGIAWELFLPSPDFISVQATTARCRLYHKEAIAERIRKSIANRFSAHPFSERNLDSKPSPAAAFPQTIFVRGVSDHFLLSLDTGGEMLYKRSIKTRVGRAPLRETLAAAALMWAGYTGDKPLIDPMCGSGAFSLEAALMAGRIPPSNFRDFAFMGWPAFRPKRWAYIKEQAQKEIRQTISPIFASDLDKTLCRDLEKTAASHGLGDWITVCRRNFFDFSPKDLTGETGWVTLNPPYGRRLGRPDEWERLFHGIRQHLSREYRGWTVVLIAPGRNSERSLGFPVAFRPFFHGGLQLQLLIGKIP